MKRVRPKTFLQAVNLADHHLSEAQRALSTQLHAESREQTPIGYSIADATYAEIEKLRILIVKRVSRLRADV